MADEEVVEEVAEEKKSGKLGLILMVVGLLVAIGGGLGVYFLVIAPKFVVDEDVADEPEDEYFIPMNPVYVYFDAAYVNLMRDGDDPASTLLYKISFECSDQDTATLIEESYKSRFVDMLNKLHDSRTRAEVDDILLFKESIQRQALQRSNDLLQRMIPESIKGEDRAAYRVTAVLHEQCMVSDPS